MADSVMLLWNRRPISVLIRASVQVWSGHPCATGPLASSCSSTANRGSLSLGSETGPADRSPSAPASCQARRQRCTERTLTRKFLATSTLEAPTANRSAASIRMRSRNACKYAPGPVLVELRINTRAVDVVVWDSAPTVPAARPIDPDRIGRHGLEIVKAVTAELFTEQQPVGKRITARLPIHSGHGRPEPHYRRPATAAAT